MDTHGFVYMWWCLASHTWTWWGTSTLLPPVFDIFWSYWVPFLCQSRSYWPPLSAEKTLSLSHLVPEIIWAKIGPIFHKNLSFDHFETFSILYQFSPWFSILLTPFFTVFRSFWPLILQNLRSHWVHFFITCWTPLPKICWNLSCFGEPSFWFWFYGLNFDFMV